jgi:hypothetical protein
VDLERGKSAVWVVTGVVKAMTAEVASFRSGHDMAKSVTIVTARF